MTWYLLMMVKYQVTPKWNSPVEFTILGEAVQIEEWYGTIEWDENDPRKCTFCHGFKGTCEWEEL